MANQVLLHLANPWQAIREIRRVLAPGGLLSIGEWDWDSTCLALTDRALGRRFTHLLCDQMNNGLIARELAWQLERLGYTRAAITPQVHLDRQPGPAHQWLIEPVARELVRTGALTPEEGSILLEDLHDRAADGRYFLARTYYTAIATAGEASHRKLPQDRPPPPEPPFSGSATPATPAGQEQIMDNRSGIEAGAGTRLVSTTSAGRRQRLPPRAPALSAGLSI